MRSGGPADAAESRCGIERSLSLLGDSWTFLILREVMLDRHTYSAIRDELGIASDVLAARLAALVDHGVLERREYRLPGQRPRDAYELTSAGRELSIVLTALYEWGDRHLPSTRRPGAMPVSADGRRCSAVLVDETGQPVDASRAGFIAVGR